MKNQDTIHKENNPVVTKQEVDPEELKVKINDMYTDVALNPDGVYHFKMGRDLAELLGYPTSILDKIPKESIESFAGVGYFFDLADINEGDKILDLGSGSGMDSFFAAAQTTEIGKIIGVDLNQDQLNKAEMMKNNYGFDNIEFIENDIENLPFEDESFDVIISNGVFNLIPNKQDLFKEIHRLLRPGGKLVFSDIVTDSKLPSNVKCDSTLWASCIGGAEQRDDYIRMIENASLKVELTKHQDEYTFISDQAKNASDKWGVKSYSFLCTKGEN